MMGFALLVPSVAKPQVEAGAWHCADVQQRVVQYLLPEDPEQSPLAQSVGALHAAKAGRLPAGLAHRNTERPAPGSSCSVHLLSPEQSASEQQESKHCPSAHSADRHSVLAVQLAPTGAAPGVGRPAAGASTQAEKPPLVG